MLGNRVAALTSQHPKAVGDGAGGQLDQQSRLTPTGLGFQQCQPAASLAEAVQLQAELLEFLSPGDKGRIGERVATVGRANHHRRFALAAS